MLELTKDLIPKPLLKLNGKPMIQWQMESLESLLGELPCRPLGSGSKILSSFSNTYTPFEK